MFAAGCFCFLSLVSGFSQEKSAPKSDVQLIEGTWNVVGWEVSGEEIPADKRPELLIIAGLRMEGLGQALFIKLDSSKSPKWLDVLPERGAEARAIKGIYELKDENLTICIPDTRVGKKTADHRPDTFETKGKDRILMTLKRGKDRNATLAVPLTHLLLATITAYGLPKEFEQGTMRYENEDWELRRLNTLGLLEVVWLPGDRENRYLFDGTHVSVSTVLKLSNGYERVAFGKYDLKEDFGVSSLTEWATAARIELRNGKGQSVTMRLEREKKEVKISEEKGDSQAVFGGSDKKFPSAKIEWK